MRTPKASNSQRGGAELLAALVTSEGLRPEVGQELGVRFLTLAVNGDGFVWALALAPEEDLQKYDIALEATAMSPSDQLNPDADWPVWCDNLFEGVTRLKLFSVPGHPAQYTKAVICNNLTTFLNQKEPLDEDIRETIFWELFGRGEGEQHPQDTGDVKFHVFASRKLDSGDSELVGKVLEEWAPVVRRATANCVTRWGLRCYSYCSKPRPHIRWPLHTNLFSKKQVACFAAASLVVTTWAFIDDFASRP
ncbi:hypothetical protein GNI_161380 [Gregarina niphandrodes]|uniref:Uncharacterized protein n=1 Tax=Gregarina niphandrodes TaxID=110365 RepID=A0A023AYH2_GRENI|nr:hypothetical protein GNI_161380 [Gregarina niphandrodes]EZG43711.1 hypothetical protein GNI_161380 [Gregarina niphandrodes]|eukprot:XP_011133060.1 hypothetical protein GNI_161380 [Gregarina niphandrodes]